VIESSLADMDGPRGTSMCCSLLEIGESEDADGAVRVALTGELDLSSSGRLGARLAELGRAGGRVRLDLSGLEFIDCSGMGIIVGALADARGDGWALEVDRHVSPLAQRVFALAEIESALWPEDEDTGGDPTFAQRRPAQFKAGRDGPTYRL
jgi:anti-sigma B factor antagonist